MGERLVLRIIETFSGIGAQAKALERMHIDHEIVHISEWDINAIIAYYLIHRQSSIGHHDDFLSEKEVDEFLNRHTLSQDGKSEMKPASFQKLPVHIKKLLYRAIVETHNLVSITDVKGEDIPDNIDVFTYSFPCQDLSLCGFWHGNKSGISRDAHNRSGLLWEVERILLEMHAQGRLLPRFLLMENVVSILSKTHEKDFREWQKRLEELGYYNHVYCLAASDYGIPQKRRRAFMISINLKGTSLTPMDMDIFFYQNNLENRDCFTNIKRKKLSDILKLDYSREPYRSEALSVVPNDTQSREKIYEDNDHLFDGHIVQDIIINTITTKQDRNPNSGVIAFPNNMSGKAQWRYLTPRECFLLMGFDEQDFNRIVDADLHTDEQHLFFNNEKLYRMAGNSIVVNVLEAVFSQIVELKKLVEDKMRF